MPMTLYFIFKIFKKFKDKNQTKWLDESKGKGNAIKPKLLKGLVVVDAFKESYIETDLNNGTIKIHFHI